MFALGGVATNLSIFFLTLSFAHVIKSTEPIFCVVLMLIFKQHIPSVNTLIAVLITCTGAIVASDVELKFHWRVSFSESQPTSSYKDATLSTRIS